MISVRRLAIGVDWGTHSSKWWFSAEANGGRHIEPDRLPGVVDSTIYRQGDTLILARERARTRNVSEVADPRLKRLLLSDPQGASFWDAVREGIGLSLGEAATLTIASLLGDFFRYATDRELQIGSSTEVNVRFSLPNWTGQDSGHAAARKRMVQTSAVSVGLIKLLGWEKLPKIGERTDIQQWREIVARVRAMPELTTYLNQRTITFEEMVSGEHSLDGISWRLAAESSAAGYLPLEQLLEDIPQNAKSQKHWVKLLIVDVGAGSTDAGYLISSRRLDRHELLMNYLPPARTLDYAGETLTEMLRDYYLREHSRELSIEEAETMKLSAPGKWINESFVKEWRARIAKTAADYMFKVPDEARLGEPAIPGLKIVLTGGSGLVPRLDEAVSEAVKEALGRRGVPGGVVNRTEVTQVGTRPISDEIDAARRAVSLGESQQEFAQLVCRTGFSPSTKMVMAGGGWV